MNRTTSLLLPALLLSALSPFSYAQAAPDQQPVGDASQGYRLKTTTRLVVLDVVVLDKKGNPVKGLDKSQFTVLEDKKPQTIRNFELHEPTPADQKPKVIVKSTADLNKIGTDPVDILVFDELNSKFEDMTYARDRMLKYLMRQPEILPRPTQLLAAGDAHFVVLHDYTQNRQELLDALKTHLPQYPWQMMRNQVGDGALERMAQTLGILSQIADASSGTRGRKNVVWIGAGYPSVDTSAMDQEDQDKIMETIRVVTSRMLTSHVVLYVIDPAGVQAMQQDTGTDDEGNATSSNLASGLGPFTDKLDFATFAPATGGEIFAERNDIDREVDDGLRESSSYYTLTYTPTNTDDVSTAFRDIRVKMKDPSLHAVTRKGYFGGPIPVEVAPKQDTKPSNQLKWDIGAAAQTTLPYNGLDVRADEISGGYKLNVVAKGLTWTDLEDGSRTAEVTIMAVCTTEKAKSVCHESREIKDKIKPTDDIERGERVTFPFKMDVPERTTHLRFVVRDAGSGRIGTTDVDMK
ncbi:MAG: VWA domain-containing protein [Acidobacteriaceae bacterium]|nr:VWA domain-containing protein [Acidobacteriaceae bacterium]